MSNRVIRLPNRFLQGRAGDSLFHLDISLDDTDTVTLFRDVKFVCVGGTASRMEDLALHFADTLQHRVGQKDRFDFSIRTSRYSGFKVGPVFCVNHGIGTPSANIVLQEIFKLLLKAGSSDVTLFRIGTCGGVGVPAGSIAITTEALAPGFKPVYRTSRLGKVQELPATADAQVANELFDLGTRDHNGYNMVKGKTYCSDGFYEAQGRLDGAFCDYDSEEKMDFLRNLRDLGVVNIEMESACVLALSQLAGIKAAVVCAVLVDRLEGDLPDLTKCPNVERHLLDLVSQYIAHKLAI